MSIYFELQSTFKMKTIQTSQQQLLLGHIRLATLVFMALLIVSGLTAFPLRTEIEWMQAHAFMFNDTLQVWIYSVYLAIQQTPEVMLYGTDWLAFAHIVIALFFLPFYFKPIQYQLNLIIGMTACLLVFPLAFVCGPLRGIPLFHQFIDCAFGLGGFALLYYIYSLTKKIKA